MEKAIIVGQYSILFIAGLLFLLDTLVQLLSPNRLVFSLLLEEHLFF
jgi:hypothetical protein